MDMDGESLRGAPTWFGNMWKDDRKKLTNHILKFVKVVGASAEGLHKDLAESFHMSWLKFDDVKTLTTFFGLHVPENDAEAKQLEKKLALKHNPELAKANAKVNKSVAQQLGEAGGAGETEKETPDGKLAKSQTHGAKYMRFLRGGRNPRRPELTPQASATFNGSAIDRAQLFAVWQDSNEDWGYCELYEERFKVEMDTMQNVHGWLNQYDLMDKYKNNEQLVKTIIQACVEEGKSRPCPEHPKNKDLMEYWVRVKTVNINEDKAGKKTGLTLKAAVNKASAVHICGSNGVFANGARPASLPACAGGTTAPTALPASPMLSKPKLISARCKRP